MNVDIDKVIKLTRKRILSKIENQKNNNNVCIIYKLLKNLN